MGVYLVILGGTFNLLTSLSYVRDTFLGRTKPNRITWLMWTIGPVIAGFAGLTKGAGWATLPVFISAASPFLILVCTFFNTKAYWKLGFFDYACGLLSILALVLWGLTQEANIAILFAVLSDSFAALPTLLKAWKHPHTETSLTYVGGFVSACTTFAVIKVWNFSSLAFPIYLLLANGSIIVATLRGKYGSKRPR